MFSKQIQKVFERKRYFDLTVKVAAVMMGFLVILIFTACETMDRAYKIEKTARDNTRKVQILEQKLDSITNLIYHETDSLPMP